MIISYTFGKIMIDGKTYNEDVIVLPDGRVISPWWRNAGHVLSFPDIKKIVSKHVRNIIVSHFREYIFPPSIKNPAESLYS